jgi:hypothetical protein
MRQLLFTLTKKLLQLLFWEKNNSYRTRESISVNLMAKNFAKIQRSASYFESKTGHNIRGEARRSHARKLSVAVEHAIVSIPRKKMLATGKWKRWSIFAILMSENATFKKDSNSR